MAAKSCAACGKEAEGRFCSWCGAALAGTHCSSCGSAVEPGARFCNACGAPVGAAGSPAGSGAATGGGGGARGQPSGGASGGSQEGSRLVWGVAGVFLVGLILAIAIPAVRDQEANSPPANPAGAAGGAAGAPTGGAGSVDLASMTPRQRADALYERIMTASSGGDSTGAAFFIPMGLQAYDMARPLDADGHFHLSLLQRMAGDSEAGLAIAREALAAQPNHLLNLASAAGAAAELGDTTAAREYYRKYLDVYDDERARGLTEYELHRSMFDELNEEAESFLGAT